MEALRSTMTIDTLCTARPPSALWERHRAWARARRRQQSPDAVVVAAAAASSSAPRPLPPWSAAPPPQPNRAWDKGDPPPLPQPAEEDADAHRRAALRELLGGLRDDAALDALDARAPGAAGFTPPALAATLDALGTVLGLERRHLLRVVALAPRLLTDPARARRVVEALGRVLGAPRPTDVAAYGRAFPPLFALVPDDGDGEEGEEGDDDGAEETGLRGRVRALARLLVVAGGEVATAGSPASPPAKEEEEEVRLFRAWAREFPPRAAALLSQPAAEVAAKVSRLEFALGPAAGGGGGGSNKAASNNNNDNASDEYSPLAAARLLALARPMLLDIGAVVVRSRVAALAQAARVDAPALAALALSAGRRGAEEERAPGRPPWATPPLVPLGVQGLAELLMCAPQRLSEWTDALSALLLPPFPGEPPRTWQAKDALPLRAAAAHALGPRAFALEVLLLIGARNPADVVVRWRSLQTAVWKGRAAWREEVEQRWGAREVAAALTARHEQLARVAFLASSSSEVGAGAAAQEEVGLMEAIRGTADFDRRFPEFRRWLDGKQ